MFPMNNTLWIACTVMTIVLIVPIIANRLRFPAIAGLIVAGVLVGPGSLGLLQAGKEIDFFSNVGLLFIMFFAGLEIDLEEMKKNKLWGVTFGFLTFLAPFLLTYLSGYYMLGLGIAASGVMACILGSHTLVSYPIISRYGQGRRKSVTISVAGALVAIILALVSYTMIQATLGSSEFSMLAFVSGSMAYAVLVIIAYPRVARWFFSNVKSSSQHFVFVLIMLALSCGLAEMAGLERILGAFLAGLVLNRYIPKSSPLMNRLDFVGNALFIPVFLVNTGMMIDLRAISGDFSVLLLAAVLFIAGTAGKWIVAYCTQKACKLTEFDRRIIFGLSESHAAGALAIAMGAYSVGILDNSALSATVLIVLFSCILSNLETERGARELHNRQISQNNVPGDRRLLVVLTGSNTLQAIMDTAMTLHAKDDRSMVGLYVTVNGDHAQKYMNDGRNRLDEAARIAASAEIPFVSQNRLGNNITESIIHASEEYGIDHMLMGLPLRNDITTRYYESIIRCLTDGIRHQIVLQRFTTPLNTIRRLTVLVPGPVVQDDYFEQAMKTVYDISMTIGCACEFYGKDQAVDAVRSTGLNFASGRVRYNAVGESADMNWVMTDAHKDHLLLLIGQRDSDTHAGRAFLHLYERIHFMQADASIMIIYPATDGLKSPSSMTSARTERDFLKMLRM